MKVTARRLVLAVLLAALAGCGGGNASTGPAAKACDPLPTADPTAKVPSGFPTIDGQVLFDPATQGKTEIVFAIVDNPDFVGVRDALVAKLTAAGFTIDGTDQESVEAEAQFSGAQEGTIKVEPFCKGHVKVRYKFQH